jgi:hypothetical protein
MLKKRAAQATEAVTPQTPSSKAKRTKGKERAQ